MWRKLHRDMNITPLPLVEKEADYIAMRMIHNETGHYEPVYQAELKRLTQDRDLAYTRLIKGIEGRRGFSLLEILDPQMSVYSAQEAGYNQALADIIEKVVKPLYGKE